MYGIFGSDTEKDRMKLIDQGIARGAQSFRQKTGVTDEQLSMNIQDIIGKTLVRTQQEGRGAEEIRRGGQATQRRVRQRGGSDEQIRQAKISTDRAAGLAAEQFQERQLAATRNLLGNLLSNQTGLELGTARLMAANQEIKQDKGKSGFLSQLLGDIF